MGAVCCNTTSTVAKAEPESVYNAVQDSSEQARQDRAGAPSTKPDQASASSEPSGTSGLAGMAEAAPKPEEPAKKDPGRDVPKSAGKPSETEKDTPKPAAKPSEPVKKQAPEPLEPPEGAPKKGEKTPPDKAKFEEMLRRPDGIDNMSNEDMALFKKLRGACWTDDDQIKLNAMTKMLTTNPDKVDYNQYSKLDQRKPNLEPLQEQNSDGDMIMVTRGDRVSCNADDPGIPGDNEKATRKQLMYGYVGDIEFVDADGDYLINFFRDDKKNKPIKPPFRQWVFKGNFTGDYFESVFVPGVADWKRMGGKALEPLMDVTTLIDVRWLLKFAKGKVMASNKKIVPAWQKVPQDGMAQLQHMQYFCEASQVCLSVAVLSYGWAARSHPDPTGEQLQHLVKVLETIVKECDEAQKEVRKVDGLKKAECTWGMVWDFMSLPQRGYTKAFDANTDDRTPVQINRFKKGLKGINEWYGHPMSNTLVLNTPMPASAENHAEYAVRGWCIFERRMSSLVKDNNCYLELNKEHLEEVTEWNDIINTCTKKRPAPMAPDVFTKKLLDGVEKENAKPGTGIKFTSGKDLTEIVIPQYEKGFIRIMNTAKSLEYRDLDWGDDDAEDFASTMKWMHINNAMEKLMTITIQGNQITDRGGKAIAAAMSEGAFQGIVEFKFLEDVGEATAEAFAAPIDAGLFGTGPVAKQWLSMGAGSYGKASIEMGGDFKGTAGWNKMHKACKKHHIAME